MSYISLSNDDIKEMLAKVGITSLEELFSSIPKNIKLNRSLDVPGPLSEAEVMAYFEKLENTKIPPFKVNIKIHNLLQKFITTDGFDIELSDEK